MGMVVIAAAVLNDLAGWIVFATLLGLIGAGASGQLTPLATIGLTVGLCGGRVDRRTLAVPDRTLPDSGAHQLARGVLGFAMFMALLLRGADPVDWRPSTVRGLPVRRGLGRSEPPARKHARDHRPLRLVHLCAALFRQHRPAGRLRPKPDPLLVAAVLVAASVCKIVGCAWGARRGGTIKSVIKKLSTSC